MLRYMSLVEMAMSSAFARGVLRTKAPEDCSLVSMVERRIKTPVARKIGFVVLERNGVLWMLTHSHDTLQVRGGETCQFRVSLSN